MLNPPPASVTNGLERLRHRMVEHQIAARGVRDNRVLDAMRTVPRHEFVIPSLLADAYADTPLPIGEGQTISQPFMVAYMAEAAQITPTDKVLEVGTGCGYSAAVLSQLAEKVYTVEVVPALAETAKVRLEKYLNVHSFLSDGTMGLTEHAPYDAIIVTAGAPHVPASLLDQLSINGRLVIPVRNDLGYEDLVRIHKQDDNSFSHTILMDVRFVPLIGKDGWSTG